MMDTDVPSGSKQIPMTGSANPKVPYPVTSNSGASKLIVNRRRQEGNPLLRYVTNVRYEWGDVAADFECGPTCGVVYLAMKYHRLHPDYVLTRVGGSGENKYSCKILLLMCNVDEPRHQLRELNLLCFRMEWTLVVCYSVEEAGEYIENLKLVEHRDPSQKKQAIVPQDERTKLLNFAISILTAARSVTKSDAQRLLFNFGSLKNICEASEEQLALCVGLGPIKAKNLYTFLRTDFSS